MILFIVSVPAEVELPGEALEEDLDFFDLDFCSGGARREPGVGWRRQPKGAPRGSR